MKTIKIISILAAVMLFSTASTCSDDDNSNDNSSQYVAALVSAISTNVQQGTWRVTYFYDSDTDETAHFTGYAFTFGSNNQLTATNGSASASGTWSVTDSHSGFDDHPHTSSDIDFNINFASPDDFEDLSEDWDIVSQTATKIELVHVSGGNGGTDHLVFEKN